MRRRPRRWLGGLLALGIALLVAACRGPAIGAPSASVPASSQPSPAASLTPTGPGKDAVTIRSGARYATQSDGVGWILTITYEDPLLLLTSLSLMDGASVTTLIDDQEECCYGPSAAADNADHLWLTYGREILRIDMDGGHMERLDLPAPATDASPSDEDPPAGGVGAAAWDSISNTLLFTRFSDHRLYRFDPATEMFTTVADLGIVTHNLGHVSVGGDGSVAVNGAQRVGADYLRAAVVLSPGSDAPQLLVGVEAICVGPSGMFALYEDGDVKLDGQSVGQVEFEPFSDVSFACSPDGHAFTVGEVASLSDTALNLVIYRFGLEGASTVALPMTLMHGTNPHDGTPMDSWSGPSVGALLPDGLGGVWLINEDGTSSLPGIGPSPYASFMHVMFAS